MRIPWLAWLMWSHTLIALPAERVDFSYAFAPPHRMTVGRPAASEKTLLDAEPGLLTVSWSNSDLRGIPPGVWQPPPVAWKVRVQPLLDGQPFASSGWMRVEGFLPLLDNVYRSEAGSAQLEALGATADALIRVTVRNTDSRPHLFEIRCEVQGGWVAHNPAWIEPGKNPDVLLAMEHERPDRILLFGVGAGSYPVAAKSLTLAWTLAAGEERGGWIVRPYAAYADQLPSRRTLNWDAEFTAAKQEWTALLGRAVRIEVPDDRVRQAFYASLGDLFIMREPLQSGYTGTICGTEIYRSTNPFEPAIAAIALDQAGLHQEAAEGLRVHLDMQEASGEWADAKGWAHHMWGAAGMKAWAAMEHYRLTGDADWLKQVYPRLSASTRWQEEQRSKTRVMENGQKPAFFGLMPRGMGDGGLMNGGDFFGVFYPHNFMAVFADRIAVEAARILGQTEDVAALTRIYQTGLADLRASLDRGVIHENGARWIPGSPGNTSGSLWGALWALFPTEILAPDDPLISGTIAHMERSMSPGGHPVHTGWMTDGIWPAITLDNLAEAHLMRDEGDAAIAYLYATLNHGTPLFTWCEERGLEPGSAKTSGDRQHLWTPVAVVRFLRDALAMEQGEHLHLGRGTARSWLDSGKVVALHEAATHFGPVSYRIDSDVLHHVIRIDIDAPRRKAPEDIVLHVRHPQRAPMQSVTVNHAAWHDFDAARETIRLTPGGALHVEVQY